MGYPRAALFAFCMSVIAGNALAVLKGNLRAVHGDEMVDEVSNYALVNDAAEIYPGMMIAVTAVGVVVSGGMHGQPGGRTVERPGRQSARGTDAPIATRTEEAEDDKEEYREQDPSRCHQETPGQVQGSPATGHDGIKTR